MTTLLAVPIPGHHWRLGESWTNNRITELGHAIREMGDDPENRIFIADVADGYDSDTDNQPDHVHPGKLGEDKMAAKFFEEVKQHCVPPYAAAATTSTGSSVIVQPRPFHGPWDASGMTVHIVHSANGTLTLTVDLETEVINGTGFAGCNVADFCPNASNVSTENASAQAASNASTENASAQAAQNVSGENASAQNASTNTHENACGVICNSRNITVTWPPGRFGGSTGRTFNGYLLDAANTTVVWIGLIDGVYWLKPIA